MKRLSLFWFSFIFLSLWSHTLEARNANRFYINRYTVVETEISEEEYLLARTDFDKFNYRRDTSISFFAKKKIEVAVFKTLSKDEQSEYVWTDLLIEDIGSYSSGEFVANIRAANWCVPVFLDKKMKVDRITINCGIEGVYSKDGIYAGCREFDCDNIAWITFLERGKGRTKPIAVYKNNQWRLRTQMELSYSRPCMFWNDGYLFCAGIKNGGSFQMPVYYKLRLKKTKRTIKRLY